MRTGLLGVTVVCVVASLPTSAHAGVLGRFIASLTKPTLDNFEMGTHRVLDHAEAGVSRQIAHASREVTGAIDHAGVVFDDKLTRTEGVAHTLANRVDVLAAARIAQVDAAVKGNVGYAFDRADATIAGAVKRVDGVVTHLDAATQKRLEQADRILEARIDQIEGAVAVSIADADRAVADRIDQVDEVAGKRLGTLDVLATKQSLALEETLLKIAGLVGVLAFLVFVLMRVWAEFVEDVEAQKEERAREAASGRTRVEAAATNYWRAMRLALKWTLVRVAVAVVLGAGLYAAVRMLPVGARQKSAELTQLHEEGLRTSFEALDFAAVRYHAAQLVLLSPTDTIHRGIALEAALIFRVFAQPHSLDDPAMVQRVRQDIARAKALLGPGQPASDLETVSAYVDWRVAVTESARARAIVRFAEVLRVADEVDGEARLPFVLRPVAQAYAALGRGGAPPAERAVFAPLEHALAYNALVHEQVPRATTAYLDLLDAQAELERALPVDRPQRLARRTDSAKAVIEVWRMLDAGLADNRWIHGSRSPLAALALNDVPLAHALWYAGERATVAARKPAADDRAPRIAAGGAPAVRAAMLPVRLTWLQRYTTQVGPRVARLIQLEMTESFLAQEASTLAFQREYIEHRLRVLDGGSSTEAQRDALLSSASAAGLDDEPRLRDLAQGRAMQERADARRESRPSIYL